jgi:molybdenum ABC transporter molybdate-binding protein
VDPAFRQAGKPDLPQQTRPGASEFWLLAGLSALVVGGLSLLLWAPWSRQGITSKRSLVFYCAAGMAKPVKEIAADYEKRYGVQVQATFAGSGQLLSTIRASSVGDLFLSADKFHMDKARKEKLVAEVIPVATLEPVLIVKTTTQDKLPQGKKVKGLNDLLRPDFKVVLANPELAAIGTTVKTALSDPKINLWPQLEKELKQSSNRVSTVGTVNEVATAVRISDGVLGIVWRANAKNIDGVEIITLPELEPFKELIQIGILTTATDEQATAALQFARFLTARDEGLPHFTKHNFDVIPDADAWEERPLLHLSAGAMLKPGIDDVVKAFAQREGVTIDTSYAGCGLLVSQMKAIKEAGKPGAFPDAYFACDTSYLDKVQQWFEAAVMVSSNDLVLIVRKGNPKHVTDLEDLTRDDLKIGLANPEWSALGKISDDLLKKTDLYDKVYVPGWEKKGRIVPSEAGHDLVQKVRIGALDAALVYRSNAQSNPDNLKHHLDIVKWNITDALANQPFAIAKNSPHQYLMKRLLAAIVAQQSADHFEALGFRWVYGTK